jgi:capsular exopolysaccharide synthesis family protein
MVTSALGGEGKTLLSCHLAVSLARAGLRTLLLDCDLRRPSVHRIFNLPLGPGLAELLRAEMAPGAVGQPGPVPGLTILSAGYPDGQALQALGQGALQAVLRTLRDQFDFILMDSAPVLPVNDSQIVGQYADGVVLAVRQEVTRLTALVAAYERLTHLNIHILGAVANGVRSSASYVSSYYTAEPVKRPALAGPSAAPAAGPEKGS